MILICVLIMILSTNTNPIENIELRIKILSKKEITSPITITDMAIDDHNADNKEESNNNNNKEDVFV